MTINMGGGFSRESVNAGDAASRILKSLGESRDNT